MSAQHTPTPWQDTPDARGHVKLIHVETAHDNPHGAGMPVCSIPTKRAEDAAFIVRACNAHDELVAARELSDAQHQRAMRVVLDIRDELAAAARAFRIAYYPIADGDKTPQQRELCERLDAALAKAGAA